MRTGRTSYKDIQDTIAKLLIQVNDSLPYATAVCPKFSHPRQLFEWLKKNTFYKKDPLGIELLQEMQTMFEDNKYGRKGQGDCDCFTITTLACMWAQGWKGLYIVLVGNSKRAPQHIYSAIDFEDSLYILDLTNPYFNMERAYKNKQLVPV